MKRTQEKGITLIALVVTIIILIILAGVSINLIFGQAGLINRAKYGSESQKEVQAKEKLELVLADMYAEKFLNKVYDSGDYLTEKLRNEGFIVLDNIVIVDGYKFEIDRNVPEIVNSLGKGEENSEITIIVSHEVTTDFTKATITVEVEYAGTIEEIKINGNSETVPEKQDGKYTITKEVTENKTYSIYVKDENGGYKIANRVVTEISEDMEINTKEGFAIFRDRVNAGATYEGKTVTLSSDIDLSTLCSAELGKSWIPIGNDTNPFKGTFNGNNCTVSNLYINSTLDNQGLFGVNDGTIENLSVSGTSITSGMMVAGVVGKNNENGNVICCISDTYVQGQKAGGIAGRNFGSIDKCCNLGEIYAPSNDAAGIAALAGTITNCYNKGYVHSDYCSGGITYLVNGSVHNCYNIGSVYGANNVGGIAGAAGTADIRNSYNIGAISGGKDRKGQIIGWYNAFSSRNSRYK